MSHMAFVRPVVASLLLVSACGGGSSDYSTGPTGGGNPPAAVQAAAISVDNPYTFKPATVTVFKGGTVTWTWTGSGHNVTSIGSPSFSPNSGTRDAPWTFGPITFNNTGSYRFACTIHEASGMSGTVVVQ